MSPCPACLDPAGEVIPERQAGGSGGRRRCRDPARLLESGRTPHALTQPATVAARCQLRHDRGHHRGSASRGRHVLPRCYRRPEASVIKRPSLARRIGPGVATSARSRPTCMGTPGKVPVGRRGIGGDSLLEVGEGGDEEGDEAADERARDEHRQGCRRSRRRRGRASSSVTRSGRAPSRRRRCRSRSR